MPVKGTLTKAHILDAVQKLTASLAGNLLKPLNLARTHKVHALIRRRCVDLRLRAFLYETKRGKRTMELVSFISIEDEPPDLILSFAIWQPELEDIRSLIFLRTPEYEFILDETERGVKVSDEAFMDEEDDM